MGVIQIVLGRAARAGWCESRVERFDGARIACAESMVVVATLVISLFQTFNSMQERSK